MGTREGLPVARLLLAGTWRRDKRFIVSGREVPESAFLSGGANVTALCSALTQQKASAVSVPRGAIES